MVVAGLPNKPNPPKLAVVVVVGFVAAGCTKLNVLAPVVTAVVVFALGDRADTVKLPKLNLLLSALDTANESKPNVASWLLLSAGALTVSVGLVSPAELNIAAFAAACCVVEVVLAG